jgi:hypothetical protein
MRRLLCLTLMFLLAACSQQELMEKFSTPQDQAEARHYIDLLRAGNFVEIEKGADSSISHAAFQTELPKMAAVFPDGQPRSITLVGAQRRSINGDASVTTTLEYAFDGKWVLATVTIRDPDNARKLFAFKVNPEHESVLTANRFELSGKSPMQYFVLFGTIAGFTLTLWALIACCFTKMPRKGWWIVFILLGLGDLGLNWTSGEWTFHPVYLQLFSASFMKPLYGPLEISCSLPLGAILFLLRRRRPAAESARGGEAAGA